VRVRVVTSLYPGAPRPFEGIFAERRWLGMRARGHEVRVLHPQPRTFWPLSLAYAEIHRMPREELRAGIAVRRPRYTHLPGRALGNAERFARCALAHLDLLSDRERPDVVVCDYAWPASALAPYLAERGVPCVVSGRGSDVLEVAGEAGLAAPLARNLRAAGHWCGVSAELVETMDRLAQRPGRGVLVPNGVDTQLFAPRERAAARRELGRASDEPWVLVVGHLIARKDPALALEAFRRAGLERARLFFLGRGPLAGELGRRIGEAGLAQRVELVGEVSPEDLARWYAAAHAVLLTSRREGRPNVVLEALASGRPVVATAAGGTAEVVADERMLVRSRDPAELGARLAALVADPPGPAALAASVAHLSWAASLDALEALLEAAVAEHAVA